MHWAACPRGLQEEPPDSIGGCLSRVGLSSTPGDCLVPILVFFSFMAPIPNFLCSCCHFSVPQDQQQLHRHVSGGREGGRLFPLWGCTKG